MEVGKELNRNGRILDFNVINWPSPEDGVWLTLILEGTAYASVEEKNRSRKRNVIRLEKAKERRDIVNLEIHFTCCVDTAQLEAIESLVKNDDRDWGAFTMTGINDVNDFYSPRASSEKLEFLFCALRNVRKLNLHSCTNNRGHGLETILSVLSSFTRLQELSIIGWQIDRISASTLANSLQRQDGKKIHLLSLRSCRFLGDHAFHEIINGLESIEHLNTLDVSYCNLDDNDIISLLDSIKNNPAIECVNLESNLCRTQASLTKLAEWICESNCKLRTLNVRRLWTGFTEDGLEQRFVDPDPLMNAIAQNSSLCNLCLSENYLEDGDIEQLSRSLLSRHENSNLCTLDVGDNPFDEVGAQTLLHLVRDLQSIETIQFENPFIGYKCAELIKIQAEINYYRRFMGKSLDIPLQLWPHALARIQQGTNYRMSRQDFFRSKNHVYRLLRTGTGSYGKELSFRIALHNSLVGNKQKTSYESSE